MALKVFITGGTGYIGGSVLATVATIHSEYDITVMLRKIPAEFASHYPNIKVVQGDYDSADILSSAAAQADVVVHMGNSDHLPALQAILDGLVHSRQSRSPPFLIHLSGSAILNPKVWSDVDDLSTVSTLPDSAPHRPAEKLLLDTVRDHGGNINIAIVCPPDIYGPGKGLAKTWSATVPMFVAEAKKLEDGRVFYHEEGTNTKSWVHIDDLMTLYLKLVEAAANRGEGAEWGAKGYYFASTQEVDQLTLATALGSVLRKHAVIDNPEPLQVSLEQLDSMLENVPIPHISRYLFACNSRSRPDRAKKLFGYEPKAPGLLESLEADVLAEIKKAKGGQ
ncbi:nucleoside-diphosphate-sugar epimerase [Lophiostoma macrostomum CBS 122681]|uniref:Nucleoside-diphosphate-sugar epimerase n=1 Tax=Lophiostoma macrostomum CBS 122681 TaxID=1314788 RepID=A0A6A6T2W6_9PLEO|nr:nucleoside-diphosphate-sugar epimerase [Lophiostoma macrostomum CBS 122681]